jgi:hypothetical protein
MKMNRDAYALLVAEDLAWLATMPPGLERDHIEVIVRNSVVMHYPAAPAPECGNADAICGTCNCCKACYLCSCPGAPVHPDDAPSPHALPSDALAGVP